MSNIQTEVQTKIQTETQNSQITIML